MDTMAGIFTTNLLRTLCLVQNEDRTEPGDTPVKQVLPRRYGGLLPKIFTVTTS